MHICYLCHEYPPPQHGGIGSFVQMLGRELVARGHKVTAIGLYPPADARDELDCGVRVIRIPKLAPPLLRYVLNGRKLRQTLAALHATDPIDLIEGAESNFTLLSSRFSVPRLIRLHGGHVFFSVTLGKKPSRWLSRQERRSFRIATDVCGVSRFVAETTRELLGLGDRHIEVIPNPVDVEQFAPRPGISEQQGSVVFVGTLTEKKGIRQLIQAMPRVVAQVPDARLIVCGKDTTDPDSGGSFRASLESMLTDEIRSKVEFRGPVPRAQLPDIMASASVCVYPSHMEAMPIAWIEGLAMGKAMLTSHIGPGREVVEDGVTALTCNPHDPASIAEKLLRLLRDSELRTRLGAQARRSAVERFSLPTLVERNIRYYESLVTEGGSPSTMSAAVTSLTRN